MILKISRHEETEQWCIVDGIRRVHVSALQSVSPNRMREVIEEDHDLQLLDNFWRPEDEKSDAEITYRRIDCRMDDGREYSVIYDTMLYLCNDQGDTIDKFAAF